MNHSENYQEVLESAPVEGTLEELQSYIAGLDGAKRADVASVLLFSCIHSPEKVKLLLQSGARPDDKDKYGYTPLLLAVESGELQVVRLLAEAGASLNAEADLLPILSPMIDGSCEMVQLLLELGTDADARTFGGYPLLFLAAERDLPDMVGLLLAHGASPHAMEPDGGTALHAAAYNGSYGSLKLLLRAGADAFLQDKQGMIPFQYAVQQGHADCAEVLASCVRDLAARPDMAAWALGGAITRQDVERVRLLIAAGAGVNHPAGPGGKTPLMLAAELGSLELVSLLTHAGACAELTNEHGLTALAYAARSGHRKCMKLLLLLFPREPVEARNKAVEQAIRFATPACRRVLLRMAAREHLPCCSCRNKGGNAWCSIKPGNWYQHKV